MPDLYPLACKFSTENSLAQAYKEWQETVCAKYSELLDSVNYAIEIADQPNDVNSLVNQVIKNFENEDVTENSVVSLNEGCVYLKDLLSSVISSVKGQLGNIDLGNPSTIDFNINIPRINLSSISMKVSDFLNELNATFHAVTVERAVATAYAVASTVSERISIIRDTVSSVFSSGFTDFSETLNSAIEAIKTSTPISNYIDRKIVTSGIEQASIDGSLVTTSDDVQYSGASIWGGVTWSHTGNIIIDAGKNAVKVVGAAVMALFNWVGKLTSKAVVSGAQWTVNTFINPKDLEIINDKGNHTCDIFAYKGVIPWESSYNNSKLEGKLFEGPIKLDLIPCELIMQYDDNNFNKYHNLFKTFVGRIKMIFEDNNETFDDTHSILWNIENVLGLPVGEPGFQTIYEILEYIADTYIPENATLMDVARICLRNFHPEIGEVYIKCKPMNSSYLIALTKSENEWITYKDVIDQFNLMMLTGDQYKMYDQVSDASFEGDIFLNVFTGVFFTKAIFHIIYNEVYGNSQEGNFFSTQKLKDFKNEILNNLPNNIDYIKLLVDGNSFLPSGYLDDNILSQSDVNMLYWATEKVFTDQKLNPFSIAFFPYVHSQVQWSDPSFRIKSDEEHQIEFSEFLVKVIAFVVIVVITVAIFKKVKKSMNRIMLQAEGALWSATEAASKGELTDRLIKNYQKAALKAKIANFLSGNLLSASGKASSSLFQNVSDDVSDEVVRIRRLIKRD